jgi:hypothetical protein
MSRISSFFSARGRGESCAWAQILRAPYRRTSSLLLQALAKSIPCQAELTENAETDAAAVSRQVARNLTMPGYPATLSLLPKQPVKSL